MIARGEAEEGEEYATSTTRWTLAWRQTARMPTLTSTTALPLFAGDALVLCTDRGARHLDSASLQQLIVPGTSALAQTQILRKAVLGRGAGQLFSDLHRQQSGGLLRAARAMPSLACLCAPLQIQTPGLSPVPQTPLVGGAPTRTARGLWPDAPSFATGAPKSATLPASCMTRKTWDSVDPPIRGVLTPPCPHPGTC